MVAFHDMSPRFTAPVSLYALWESHGSLGVLIGARSRNRPELPGSHRELFFKGPKPVQLLFFKGPQNKDGHERKPLYKKTPRTPTPRMEPNRSQVRPNSPQQGLGGQPWHKPTSYHLPTLFPRTNPQPKALSRAVQSSKIGAENPIPSINNDVQPCWTPTNVIFQRTTTYS